MKKHFKIHRPSNRIDLIDNRQARRLMERMGLTMNQMNNVIEVTIVSKDKQIKLKNPQVFEISAKGSRIFQITSEDVEESAIKSSTIKEEDITLVMNQAGVDRDTAEAALQEAEGDIALAIMRLKS
ncbi:MAG: nascent polypeptide-associated complex protein [Conexivisphaerales archaeon]